jgi:hypothetical protein
MGRGKGCIGGKGAPWFFFFFFFTVEGGRGWRLMFFFSLDTWKGGRSRGVRGTFFFWKCFFHCGEAREGKGVIFFTNSLWDGGKGAPWFFLLVHSWSTLGARTNHGQHGHTRLTTARTWGKSTTFPLIVYSAARDGGYIQMAIFSGTPKLESRNCPGLESRNFGRSYLPTTECDRNKVWSKVVALVESFPTSCCTLKSDIGKRLIPDF